MTIVFKVMRKGVEYEAMIDDEDADLLVHYWHVHTHKKTQTAYLVRSTSGTYKGTSGMHRVIMGRILGRNLEKWEEVDHRDLNGLNNQRDNLRVATRSQQSANRRMRSENTTGFKGVGRKNSRYFAAIRVNGKHKHLGMFDTPEEAHEAYVQAAKRYYGEFARGE